MADVKCPIPITKMIMPSERYSIKCPYTMEPEEIAIHNTANDASAMSEVSYMVRNNNTVSFHFAIDDTRAVQGIELNRNSWNAGDGKNGRGNRKAISIEICYSKSGGQRFTKAEDNTAKFVAFLLYQYGWGIEKVKKHQNYNGKYCPHRTLDMGWHRFITVTKNYLAAYTKQIEETKPLKYKVGDEVVFSKCYVASQALVGNYIPASKMDRNYGKITKVYEGTNNPYLLDDGLCFVNDECITGYYKKQSAPKVETPVVNNNTTKYKVGDDVKFSKCYISSTKKSNESIPVSRMAKNHGKITKVYKGANNPYLLDGGMCFVNDDSIVGIYKESTIVNHKVKINETLSGIANKYGTTVSAILKLNPNIKNPNVIYKDQIIRVK